MQGTITLAGRIFSGESFKANIPRYNNMERRTLFAKLERQFGESVLDVSSPGLANLLAFKEGAGNTFHSFNDDSEGIDSAIERCSSIPDKE